MKITKEKIARILAKINESQEKDCVVYTEANTPKSLIEFWDKQIN